jgi:hypothetical protein
MSSYGNRTSIRTHSGVIPQTSISICPPTHRAFAKVVASGQHTFSVQVFLIIHGRDESEGCGATLTPDTLSVADMNILRLIRFKSFTLLGQCHCRDSSID